MAVSMQKVSLSNMRERCAETDKRVSELEAKNATIQTKIEELKKINALQQSRLEALESSIKEKDVQIRGVQKENERIDALLKKKEQQYSELEKAKNGADALAKEREGQIRQLQSDAKTANAAKNELIELVNEKNGRISQIEKACDEATKRLMEANEKVMTLKANFQNASGEFSDLPGSKLSEDAESLKKSTKLLLDKVERGFSSHTLKDKITRMGSNLNPFTDRGSFIFSLTFLGFRYPNEDELKELRAQMQTLILEKEQSNKEVRDLKALFANATRAVHVERDLIEKQRRALELRSNVNSIRNCELGEISTWLPAIKRLNGADKKALQDLQRKMVCIELSRRYTDIWKQELALVGTKYKISKAIKAGNLDAATKAFNDAKVSKNAIEQIKKQVEEALQGVVGKDKLKKDYIDEIVNEAMKLYDCISALHDYAKSPAFGMQSIEEISAKVAAIDAQSTGLSRICW